MPHLSTGTKEKKLLQKIKTAVKAIAPNCKETVSYGIPTFDLNGKHLVHVAVYKKHLGLYPTPSAIVAFKKELAPYKTSKGAIQFPFEKPIPITLIKRIIRFRVKQVLEQINAKPALHARAKSKKQQAK